MLWNLWVILHVINHSIGSLSIRVRCWTHDSVSVCVDHNIYEWVDLYTMSVWLNYSSHQCLLMSINAMSKVDVCSLFLLRRLTVIDRRQTMAILVRVLGSQSDARVPSPIRIERHHTVQRLKGANRTIFYHVTLILQYRWDKTIARGGNMYRDDFGLLTLVIICFGITNTSVQNFAIRISSLNCTEVFAKTKNFLTHLI